MQFVYYHPRLDSNRTLIVDGVERARLNLSHWPNNESPEHLKADTSTEMCLKFAADPYSDRLLENIEFVSNNHFDTDGLLSVWTILHPREALAHREFLLKAAAAGDFGYFTSWEAVKFDLIVSAFEDPHRSPLRSQFSGRSETEKYQLAYDTLLDELPGLLVNFEKHRDLYEDEFKEILESQEAIVRGAAQVTAFPFLDFAVVEFDRPLNEQALINAARADRILLAQKSADGWHYSFLYHIFTWFETVSRPVRPRVELTPLAAQLNAIENASSCVWIAPNNDELWPRLRRETPDRRPGASSIAPNRFTKICMDFLTEHSNTLPSPMRAVCAPTDK